MPRGAWDNPVLDDRSPQPFSRREAWFWMYEQAAYQEKDVGADNKIVRLQRGQLCYSLRALGKEWGWHHLKVRRFLESLNETGMIRLCSGSETGNETAPAIITICNYEDFGDAVGTTETATETAAKHNRNSNRNTESKESNKEEYNYNNDDNARARERHGEREGRGEDPEPPQRLPRPDLEDDKADAPVVPLRPGIMNGGWKTPIDENWRPGERGRAYAIAAGRDEAWIERNIPRFIDWNLIHDHWCADWEAAWRRWVDRAEQHERNSAQGRLSNGYAQRRPLAVEVREERTRHGLEVLSNLAAKYRANSGNA
jgi:hypothetical protein